MSAVDSIPLDVAARDRTLELTARIVATIESAGGWIRFDRYMQSALYEPGLGYYSADAVKIGPGGDFTTAPELGPFLADALAGFFAPLLGRLDAPRLLELGAGTGRLACRLLETLTAAGRADLPYAILETSPDLRRRQQDMLAAFDGRVEWIERLPEAPFEGIVFANEVADALPVVPFVMRDGRAWPLGVTAANGVLALAPGDPDPALDAAVAAIEVRRGSALPDGYRSEVCLLLPVWIESLAAILARGGLMLIDYGLPTREYYHDDRASGTLICHFRHRAHADPLFAPGLQDITAWVDFGAAARAGTAAGLQLDGFTTQGQFLLEWLSGRGPAALDGLGPREQSALKTLLLPGEMGERFKLLWLTRSLSGSAVLPGRDFRRRL